MTEIEIQTGLRENTVGLLERFAEVAATDPLVAAMLITGAILTLFASAVFGVLTVGAVLDAIGDVLSSSSAPSRRVR